MPGTPTAGGKYILTFTLEGSGEKQLDSIVKGLESIAEQAGKGGAASAVKVASKAVNVLGSNAVTTAVKMGLLKDQLFVATGFFYGLQRVGDGMRDVGEGIVSSMINVGRSVIAVVGETERSIMQLKVLGRMSNDQARNVQKQVDDLVAYTPFMTQELMGIGEALVIGKVSMDIWRDSTGKAITLADQAAKGFSSMDDATRRMAGGVKVSAMSVMADFSAITGNVGQRMPFFVRGMQRMFSTGSGRLLLDQVNAEAREVLMGGKGSAQMQGTAEETIARMYKYLQGKNAVGMAAMASSTASGIMSNLAEIPLLIYKAIGGDPMDPKSPFSKMKTALSLLFTSVANVVSDPKWREGIAAAVTPVIEMFGYAFEKIGKAVSSTMVFFADHPTLTSWALRLSAVGAVVLIISGIFASLVATLGLVAVGIAAGFITFTTYLPAILTGLASLTAGVSTFLVAVGPFLVVAGAVAVGIGIVLLAFREIFELSPAMNTLFTGFSAFFTGMLDAVTNWSGSTTKITRDTARKLQDAGLLTPFLGLIRGMEMTKKMGLSLWESIRGGVADAIFWFATLGGSSTQELEKLRHEIKGPTLDAWSSMASAIKMGFVAIVNTFANFFVVLAMFNVAWAYTAGVVRIAIGGIVSVFASLFNVFAGLFQLIPGLSKALEHMMSGNLTQAGIEAKAAWTEYKKGVMEPFSFAGGIAEEEAGKTLAAEDFLAQMQAFRDKGVEGIVSDARPLGGVVPEGVMTVIPMEEGVTPGVPTPDMGAIRTKAGPIMSEAAEEPIASFAPAIAAAVKEAVGPISSQPGPPQTINLMVDAEVLASVVVGQQSKQDDLNYTPPEG